VLPFKDSKDPDDEKHVHPLQLDVIERAVTLWSNPGEVVLSPFMGVGSEGVKSVALKRRFIGTELKPQYYELACLNVEDALREQHGLFASAM
jgi:DNA modification methylase